MVESPEPGQAPASLRVLQVINSYSAHAGGAERLVRNLHLALGSRGVRSEVVGLQAHTDSDLSGSASFGLRSPYSLRAPWLLWRYLRRHGQGWDLIHAHLFPANFYVSVLQQLRLIRVPTIATEHNTSNSRRDRRLGFMIDSLLYRGFDRIIAISQGVAEELARWMPAASARIRVVENGIVLGHDGAKVRSAKKPVTVLSVGNLRASKNYAIMLRSLALLPDLDWEYWIAGDGEQAAELKLLASELDISKRVRFLGHVQDVDSLYEEADIFLMASAWEGFGLAAVEAMNASLPVVASNIPGIRDIVSGKSVGGLLVDPESPVEISAAINELANSPALRHSLGEIAFANSLRFDEARMVQGHVEIYEQLRAQS